MTFSISVPNATQSPGLFPAQNNTNFQRLKEIINNDHNFLDTAGAAQGIHRQTTLINRSAPGGLTAGNGILYSALDSNSLSQLNWYNGVSNRQITPGVISVSASASLINGASTTILADPGYAYQAWLFANIDGSSGNPVLASAVHFSNNANTVIQITTVGNAGPFSFSYVGNDLKVTNGSGVVNTIIWTIMVNRL